MYNNKIKLMLIEDQKIIRFGIKTILEEYDSFKVIAESEYGKTAVNIAINAHPDVILLDIMLPDISGISVIKNLNDSDVKAKIAVLTADDSIETVKNVLSLGINAYVLKDTNPDMLINAVKSANYGALWIDSKIMDCIKDFDIRDIQKQSMSRNKFKAIHSNLTRREYEVLKLVVDGMSNLEIASALSISEHTAKAHVCNIIQKLLVDDRTQAAVKALKEGLV